jgi:PAS domain S-box-containing protein
MSPFFTRETEKLLFKLVDDANMLFFYLNTNGHISICNKKVEDIIGKSRDDIIGKHWLHVLYHDVNTAIKQQMFKAVIDDSLTYKRSNNFEGVIVDVNNNERFISWSITPILGEAGALEGILFIGNDITALKEREVPLRRIDDTLKDIFSSIKEYALYVINLDGNITYYGMGSEIMFGWRKNEIIFKHASILHAKDETSPTLPFILEEVKRSGQCELEVNLVKKDGQSFPVILTASKFLDTEGRTTGYIFIAKDITERKKLEYQIFQAEKLAAIGQLAAGMAHEVNNPLFVISGRLEVLLGQKRLASKVKESLETINAQADRIRKLVDRMLKFSRQAPPRLEAININDVIENVLPLLSYQKLTSAKVDIEKDLEKGLPLIKGDLSQLQEVFVNLFINAYQSMAEGGKLTIKTSNFENSYAQILISDTGCGIPQQSLKNLFMPFFSTKKEGTGLGLSICYNIIKSHNGSIDIETQVNKGTTFIIKLPFAKLEKENLGV